MRKQLALVAVISIAVASAWGLRHRHAPQASEAAATTRLLAMSYSPFLYFQF